MYLDAGHWLKRAHLEYCPILSVHHERPGVWKEPEWLYGEMAGRMGTPGWACPRWCSGHASSLSASGPPSPSSLGSYTTLHTSHPWPAGSTWSSAALTTALTSSETSPKLNRCYFFEAFFEVFKSFKIKFPYATKWYLAQKKTDPSQRTWRPPSHQEHFFLNLFLMRRWDKFFLRGKNLMSVQKLQKPLSNL